MRDHEEVTWCGKINETLKMNRKEEVLEFLGRVPLLQRLPDSSIRKISEHVIAKHYERGEYVAREGELGDGTYFIWDGEVEVVGFDTDFDRQDFQLKKYDYFGCGLSDTVHSVDVVALSKLTCLVLPREHTALLWPKFIRTVENSPERCLAMGDILQLEQLKVDIFQGKTLPGAPNFGKVFGGQLVGQALVAASKTIDSLKLLHSLHSYFILKGDLNVPIIYQVHRLRDGKNFSTRKVDAIQKGNVIFTLMASFQREEPGFDHQEVAIPPVAAPEMLLSLEELRERRLTDPRLAINYRNKIAKEEFVPWPIDIRFCEPRAATNMTKTPPSLKYWFRSKEKLSDDQALHRFVVAYASDLIFLQVSLNRHRGKGFRARGVSLDHAMWFHRPLKADEWVLFSIFAPTAHEGRAFVVGQMFNQKGEHLVTLIQEGLTRNAKL